MGSGRYEVASDDWRRVADRSTRTTRDRRRRIRSQRLWLRLTRWLTSVAAAALIAFLWMGAFWRWDGLLTVTGNRLVSRQEIFARLYIPQRTPLYLLNPQTISAQLSSIPAVARVATRRWLFPPRLEVMILERQALVKIEGSPGEATSRWIDQEGVVFAAPTARMEARFPIRVWSDLQPGERLPRPVQQQLFELLVAWPAKLSGRLDLRNPGDMYAAIGDWPVRLGEPEEAGLKLAIFADLQPLAKGYGTRLKYINLRFPRSPTFVLKSGDEVKVEKGPDASPGPSPSARPKPTASSSG